MSDIEIRARAILEEALEREDPEQIRAYVDEVCGDDVQLRARVDDLLRAHQDVRKFLDGSRSLVATIDGPIDEKPGTRIGPYKLLQKIGEGGMGVVYMADQKEPVKRRVALKIIKPGMDTRHVIARFEAERQALAMMDHPNIAKVLDAGTTESGRPYFVMELVNGTSVTKFCDEKRLAPKERLALFIPICQAIHHAHQKGIIHRDLKPGNILVAMYDDRPVPKVIDFGVAKATSQTLTEKTLFTQLGEIVGTLDYMSPEQAQRNQLDVDTRSDIYSLGVVLYELLTGDTPFNRERLRSAAFDEMLRIIREEEPPKPSTRLSSNSETLASVAANRKTEPQKLSTLIRGDLDWIVMKALEKDRSRRYESASALAADAQRFLDDAPVEASPPTFSYKLRKFTRRNKGPLVTAATIATLLVFATGISAWLAVRASHEARRAHEANIQAETALAETKLAKQRAEAVLEYVVKSFRSPDPARDGRTITVAEVLAQATSEIDVTIGNEPEILAPLLAALGETYLGLLLPRDAIPVLEKATKLNAQVFGANHPTTLKSAMHLAEAYYVSGRAEEALSLGAPTLEEMQNVLGEDHTETLSLMSGLSIVYTLTGQQDTGIRYAEKALEGLRSELGEQHPKTLDAIKNLVSVYLLTQRREDAHRLAQKAISIASAILGNDHIITQALRQVLIESESDSAEAVQLAIQGLHDARKTFGDHSLGAASAMARLGQALVATGRAEDALPYYQRVLQITKRETGENNPHFVGTIWELARIYRSLGQAQDAVPLYERGLQILSREESEPLPLLTKSQSEFAFMRELANTYKSIGQMDKAVPLYDKVLQYHRTRVETLRTEKGATHRETLDELNLFGIVCLKARRATEAAEAFQQAWDNAKTSLGEGDDFTLNAKFNLGVALSQTGDFEKARELLQQYADQIDGTDPNPFNTFLFFYARVRLGEAIMGLKKYEEAERLLLHGYDGLQGIENKSTLVIDRIQLSIELLINLYEAWEKPEKVVEWEAKRESTRGYPRVIE